MQTSLLPYMLKFPAPTRDLHPPLPSVYHIALARNHQTRVLAMWEILIHIRPAYIYHVFCEVCPDDPLHQITISNQGTLDVGCRDVNEPKHTSPSFSLNEEDQRLFVETLAQWDREEDIINTIINAKPPTSRTRAPAPFPDL
ncbi:hypothetical protein K435DRAFT_797371 [Dendrothele bispora CBS 962.96]|uniref:Uncharacterized protein n=1 Tax=Dendrothele bispora (strain CBS 962.96) TaxID=1314807 RepID=A0A4S8M3V7_DENBC|nr:hypothetical protein K435DRAFT_797371 [Dendrothele bispora CBS 962.96]